MSLHRTRGIWIFREAEDSLEALGCVSLSGMVTSTPSGLLHGDTGCECRGRTSMESWGRESGEGYTFANALPSSVAQSNEL